MSSTLPGVRVPACFLLALALFASSSARAQEPDPTPTAASSADAAPLWILERISVRGNERTAEHVIRRTLPFHEGEPLDVEDERLEQARWQLLGSGFFESVELSIERGRERGRVVLVVTVQERNTVLLEEIGLGVSEGLNGERFLIPGISQYADRF